jgi:hypothetical protein
MSSEGPFFDTIASSIFTTEPISQNSVFPVGQGSGFNNGYVNFSGDHDWFRISLRAGETYQFRALGPTLNDPTLTLRNVFGTQLAFNDDAEGLNPLINYTATSTGTYYLDAGGFGSNIGRYSVVASEGTLNLTGNLSRTVNASGDHDWYSINLVAGQTYVFQERGSPSDGGRLSDTFEFLRNSTGAIVAQDDDGGIGLDSFIQFTPTTSGRYYLDAGAFGSNTGTYDLTARSFSVDEVSASIFTAGSLSISGVPSGVGSRAGIINTAADQDWYRVTLRAGEQYEFLAQAPNRGGAGTVLDPTLAVRNVFGTQLAFNDDSGGSLDSRILFTATSTGTHYLDVGGFSTSRGGYVVRAHEVPGNTSTYATLSVGGTRTGDIHAAGDHDWVRINLVAGQSYNFQERGSPTGDGTLSDTFLFLRNSSGTILAQDDDSGVGFNSRINFTATSSGTHYLDASAFSSNTGSYELSAGFGFVPAAATALDHEFLL